MKDLCFLGNRYKKYMCFYEGGKLGRIWAKKNNEASEKFWK